jgi:hypothetical protein
LGPLGTAVTNRLIETTPGDYDDEEFGGMMISRGYRSTRRIPASLPLYPLETLSILLGREHGPSRWEACD